MIECLRVDPDVLHVNALIELQFVQALIADIRELIWLIFSILSCATCCSVIVFLPLPQQDGHILVEVNVLTILTR